MSTYRGVALVSETLRFLLSQSAIHAVPNTQVRINPPEELSPGGGPIINIFLYAVAPSSYARNADLPTRSRDGRLMVDPTLILELDYLISFTGSPDSSESEYLLGAALGTFHTCPAVTEEVAAAAIAALNQGTGTDLVTTDLNYPFEISPLNLTIEERSKMWSVFLDTPYKLSLAYRVRAVVNPTDLLIPAQLPRPVAVVAKPTAMDPNSSNG